MVARYSVAARWNHYFGGMSAVGLDRNTDEFVRLFSLWTNSIYSYVHVLVPTHADAEDIFQEVSRTLWEKFGEYRPGPDAGFRTWALRIAQIEVLRYRQREGRRQRLFSDQLHDALDETVLVAIGRIDLRLTALGDCYRKLPDDDRRLIRARYGVGADRRGHCRRNGPLGTCHLSVAAADSPIAVRVRRRDPPADGRKGNRSNLPGRPGGCCAQIGPVPFSSASEGGAKAMTSPFLPNEFFGLMYDLVEGRLTPEKAAKLEELLLADPVTASGTSISCSSLVDSTGPKASGTAGGPQRTMNAEG